MKDGCSRQERLQQLLRWRRRAAGRNNLAERLTQLRVAFSIVSDPAQDDLIARLADNVATAHQFEFEHPSAAFQSIDRLFADHPESLVVLTTSFDEDGAAFLVNPRAFVTALQPMPKAFSKNGWVLSAVDGSGYLMLNFAESPLATELFSYGRFADPACWPDVANGSV